MTRKITLAVIGCMLLFAMALGQEVETNDGRQPATRLFGGRVLWVQRLVSGVDSSLQASYYLIEDPAVEQLGETSFLVGSLLDQNTTELSGRRVALSLEHAPVIYVYHDRAEWKRLRESDRRGVVKAQAETE